MWNYRNISIIGRAVLHRSHNETVKLDQHRTDGTIITVSIMLLNLSIIYRSGSQLPPSTLLFLLYVKMVYYELFY
jgi:hypothetical protein